MIDSIRLQSFKNHRDTTIRLGRMTLLVGPNGAGKTSVLQGVRIACELARPKEEDDLVEWLSPAILTQWRQDGFTLSLTGRLDESLWLARFDMKSQPTGGGWQSYNAKAQYRDAERELFFPQREGILGPVLGFTLGPVARQIPPVLYYQLDARRLATPSYLEEEVPRLAFDGYGLATTVAYLMTSDPDRFQLLQESVRQVVPAVRRLRVRPARVTFTERRTMTVGRKETTFEDERTVTGQELVLDMDAAQELPAHAASEGTLLTVGLLTAIVGPTRPGMVLLDDIDQALHPRAQKALVATLRQLLEQNDELQIVATSHSPYLVDELRPEEVWVLAADAEGCAMARSLADHPRAAAALEVLSTGEFLTAEGEEWVVAAEGADAAGGDR